MIIIRGIKGEQYARKIKKGIVDCRDILSAVLKPPITGYEYSDYYEKNLVKALAYFTREKITELNEPSFLYSLLIDFYIPYIYLTYFHVLNDNSLEWLEKFDDDYQFIAVNVKIDKLTQTAIGKEFFGAKMSYVDSINQLNQERAANIYIANMCAIEDLFFDKLDMNEAVQIYNTLSFPLLCREMDEKFRDIENEFRIIAYDCPKIMNGIRQQISRMTSISGKSGNKYKGILKPGQDSMFTNDLKILSNPQKSLREILDEEQGVITIDSIFKEINISEISCGHKYLGNKIDCEKYIKEMIKCKPKDIYVYRTITKEYKLDDIVNEIFLPGYQKVEY